MALLQRGLTLTQIAAEVGVEVSTLSHQLGGRYPLQQKTYDVIVELSGDSALADRISILARRAYLARRPLDQYYPALDDEEVL